MFQCDLSYSVFLQGMFIWVSKDSPQELIQNILGVPHFGAIAEDMVCPIFDLSLLLQQ